MNHTAWWCLNIWVKSGQRVPPESLFCSAGTMSRPRSDPSTQDRVHFCLVLFSEAKQGAERHTCQQWNKSQQTLLAFLESTRQEERGSRKASNTNNLFPICHSGNTETSKQKTQMKVQATLSPYLTTSLITFTKPLLACNTPTWSSGRSVAFPTLQVRTDRFSTFWQICTCLMQNAGTGRSSCQRFPTPSQNINPVSNFTTQSRTAIVQEIVYVLREAKHVAEAAPASAATFDW